jgi:hypothetical protein
MYYVDFICLFSSHQQDPIGVETLRAVLVRKGASVLADYEASGTLSESSRKLLVKIAVSELIERKGL